MLQILLENKDGSIWDISEIVTSVNWRTVRVGKAGTLTFTVIRDGLYQAKEFKIEPGSVVSVKYKSSPMFYGYVFELRYDMDDAVQITAYDQIRYLDASDSRVFKGVTAGHIIKQIAADFGLKSGMIADTKYKLPKTLHESKKLLDMIYDVLEQTTMAGYGVYVFYDDFGSLTLKHIKDMTVMKAIGDESLMTDFSYGISIDKDTFNQVVLVQDKKELKKSEVYVAQDSSNISKWGLLKYYKKVDEGLNPAQINQILDATIKAKNRPTRTLRIDAIGDLNVRSGCYIHIEIQTVGLRQLMLVDECTHKFDGSDHTMTLELKVI
jgi:hypothetical protein